jgi:phage baseplate assembly protein gpV
MRGLVPASPVQHQEGVSRPTRIGRGRLAMASRGLLPQNANPSQKLHFREDKTMHGYRGLITAVDAKEVKAKAVLPDLDGLETDWLPVPQIWTHGAQAFALPRKGQQAFVFFLDDAHLDGFIMAGRYSAKDRPPDCEAPDLLFLLEDGTKILAKPGLVAIETPGDITAKAGGDAKIRATGSVEAKAGGDAKVQADGSIEAKAGASIKAQAGASIEAKAGTTLMAQATAMATIKAPAITLDAPLVTVTGALSVGGGITAGASMAAGSQATIKSAVPISIDAPFMAVTGPFASGAITAPTATLADATIGGMPYLAHTHAAPNGPTSPPI